MPTVTILCPWHALEEELKLPDDYLGPEKSIFTGEVPCGGGAPKEGRAGAGKPILELELHRLSSGVVKVRKLSRKP